MDNVRRDGELSGIVGAVVSIHKFVNNCGILGYLAENRLFIKSKR